MLLLFTNKNHTATLHSGIQAPWGQRRFNDVSAILGAKIRIKCGINIYLDEKFAKKSRIIWNGREICISLQR